MPVIRGNNLAANVTTTSSPILALNPYRRYLFMQNRGVQNVFITFGSSVSDAPTFATALLIPPNGFIEFNENVPVDTVYAVSAAGTQLLSIIQGVETTDANS